MEKTLIKGLDVLEALALSEQPRGVTELAGELGLTKSNVHRLLQTLVHRGFARQDSEAERYSCTLRLWELGAMIAERVELAQVAQSFMRELSEQTQETIHLSILDGAEVLYVAKIDSPQPVRAYTKVGGRAPAQCVATGKAQLAYVPDEQLEPLFPRLEKYTPRSLSSLSALRTELAKVRTQGYAVNRGEWRETVCGLASPIFDASRKVVAAIGISGPIDRLTPAVLRDFAPRVQAGARSLSREMGYAG
ncbi:Transcriptional regulator KdgR [Pigmentiphaga humi]|uniref:Transcriptional regulator KdgR n=1 Tax=Pigmentiphaga humi TaxID=2478468 RepID=A0A3P4B068_9BURK|nr:IclR family transcriptional regulator [Pigmentiphaga humi]VCU68505.1 Transcriptional regulator KdgR [Pigmentiphaga humi]